MTFTLVGFRETSSNTGLQKMAALVDDHVTTSGDDLTVPELNKIILAHALSPNCAAARIDSPSLRRDWNPDLSEFINDTHFPTQQAVDEGGAATFNIYPGVNINNYLKNPLPLDIAEKLNFLLNNGGNSEVNCGLLWLSDGILPPVSGAMRSLKFTSGTTVTADVWSTCILTPTQTLPAGRYAVVGMKFVGATAVAGRLILVGNSWRPGVMGAITESDVQLPLFRSGEMGNWGEFEHDQLPKLEALCDAADTAQIVHLDLIQVRSGRAT